MLTATEPARGHGAMVPDPSRRAAALGAPRCQTATVGVEAIVFDWVAYSRATYRAGSPSSKNASACRRGRCRSSSACIPVRPTRRISGTSAELGDGVGWAQWYCDRCSHNGWTVHPAGADRRLGVRSVLDGSERRGCPRRRVGRRPPAIAWACARTTSPSSGRWRHGCRWSCSTRSWREIGVRKPDPEMYALWRRSTPRRDRAAG